MNLDSPSNITKPVLEVFSVLECHDRGNSRLQALKAQADALPEPDRQVLYKLLFAATSPTLTFGVKDLPEPGPTRVLVGPEVFFPELLQLLRQLSQRLLTGNNARTAIAFFQDRCSDRELRWVQRIIRQDLRLEMGAKDINKALGFKLVPLFEVPLATDWAKVKLEKVLAQSRDWVMQPKLDGGRCVAILPGNGGPVQLLSRTGKAWKNFESIKFDLQDFNTRRARELVPVDANETLVLDGEVVSLDQEGKINFQQIQKTMMRGDGVEVGILQFVVFDCAWGPGWYNPGENYRHRLIRAENACREINSDRVKAIPTTWWVHQQRHGYPPLHQGRLDAEGMRQHVIEEARKAVEGGYEGLMLRAADLPVENKRSKLLLKIKTFIDDEAPVVGVAEGEGKYEGSLGALVCKFRNGNLFEVGSGFSDKQRQEIWAEKDRPELMGRMVNFKYFEITDAGIPRLPIFRSFRHPDDIGGPEDEE